MKFLDIQIINNRAQLVWLKDLHSRKLWFHMMVHLWWHSDNFRLYFKTLNCMDIIMTKRYGGRIHG